MFCTKCGNQLREQDRFCSGCGVPLTTGAVPPPRPAQQLSRAMSEAKIAGVCAGVARYTGLDVTLVRVLWVVLALFPLPSLGLISYIVLWVVMPKDPVTVPVHVPASN